MGWTAEAAAALAEVLLAVAAPGVVFDDEDAGIPHPLAAAAAIAVAVAEEERKEPFPSAYSTIGQPHPHHLLPLLPMQHEAVVVLLVVALAAAAAAALRSS